MATTKDRPWPHEWLCERHTGRTLGWRTGGMELIFNVSRTWKISCNGIVWRCGFLCDVLGSRRAEQKRWRWCTICSEIACRRRWCDKYPQRVVLTRTIVISGEQWSEGGWIVLAVSVVVVVWVGVVQKKRTHESKIHLICAINNASHKLNNHDTFLYTRAFNWWRYNGTYNITLWQTPQQKLTKNVPERYSNIIIP